MNESGTGQTGGQTHGQARGQTYGPTSGVYTGAIGLLLALLVAGVALAGGLTSTSLRVALAGLLFGALCWVYFLRPRIVAPADGRTVVLRNPWVTWTIPLAAVEAVEVFAFTTIRTRDERAFTSIAVGYASRRAARRRDRAGTDEQTVMTDRLLAASRTARAVGHPDEPVQRRLAVAEIALVAALVAGLVLTFLG